MAVGGSHTLRQRGVLNMSKGKGLHLQKCVNKQNDRGNYSQGPRGKQQEKEEKGGKESHGDSKIKEGKRDVHSQHSTSKSQRETVKLLNDENA